MSNFCKCKVYMQPNCGGSWIDISGKSASVNVEGGDREMAETNLFGTDHPVVTTGKHSAYQVTCRVLYTEVADEPYDRLRGIMASGCDAGLCLRYVPLGDTSGNWQYTTVSGKLMNAPLPGGDVDTVESTMIEFKVVCSDIEKDTVA